MKLEEIASLLKTTGYPVAYAILQKGKPPDMPLVVYQEVYSNNFSGGQRGISSSPPHPDRFIHK